MLRHLIFITLFVLTGFASKAQRLDGVWSGIITRNATAYGGVESLEFYLYQYGNKFEGYSYAYKDERRFVLFSIKGKRNKKTNTIQFQEFGNPAFDLPDNHYPCEKKFDLTFTRIGKTQYLIGKWGGVGYGLDTTCFPGEDLMVVLQRIKKPDLPATQYVLGKLIKYFDKKAKEYKTDSLQQLAVADSIETRQPDVIIKPVLTKIEDSAFEKKEIAIQTKDSLYEDRKLEIQRIVKVKDSVIIIKFYDNAIVDDDTISVFVNKKLMFASKRISGKPLEFSISLTQPGQTIEIIMQAENLGSIPPNTALAVVESGKYHYEARLSSGYDKSAVIVIVYEPPL